MAKEIVRTQPVTVTKGSKVAWAIFGLFALISMFVSPIFLLFFAELGIFFGGAFALLIAGRKRTFYSVFEDRVEFNRNWITKRAARMDAAKIESVSVSNSVLGRDDYGTVLVTGSGGSKILFQVVPNPDDFATKVRSIMNDGKPASVAKAAAASPSGDLSAQIANLESLRAQGILDDDEFKKAKAKILGS